MPGRPEPGSFPGAPPPVRTRRVASIAGGASSPLDELIVSAAVGTLRLTARQLSQVRDHVAQAGFDPTARERVRAELAGVVWAGQILTARDRLPPAERHYLKHVVMRAEWPRGITLVEYVASLRRVVLDRRSGVLTSRYQGTWQVGFIAPARTMRGLRGGDWILVEYRLATGFWVSGYQFAGGLRVLNSPQRTELRWLRRVRFTSA
jgi:hypothetical protein